jgi:hypothetical protein
VEYRVRNSGLTVDYDVQAYQTVPPGMSYVPGSSRLSINGGTSYTNVGSVVAYDVTNRTAGTTDQVRVRAVGAGSTSNVLSASVALNSSAAGSSISVIINLL